MLKNHTPIIKLDGYIFDCIRCGECCKVLIKTEVSKKNFIYSYDFQGKLNKSPLTTTTVFYNEREKINSYLCENSKIVNEKFIPFGSLFLKDFPIEFVFSYQVKTNGEFCIFYDRDKKSCKIYPVRPIVCKAYPLQFNQAIIDGKLNYIPNIGYCTSFKSEVKRKYPFTHNGMRIAIDIERSTFHLYFPNQSEYFKLEEYLHYKIAIFGELWSNFFIDPLKIDPKRVRNYDRLDMSKFWSWLSENKENLDKKKLSATIREYKHRIYMLNYQFNITNNLDFL